MFKKLILVIFISASAVGLVFAWGSWGHQHINYAAIFGLPDGMKTFFYNHKDFITEEAVIPDLRKYTINDKAEFARHYIDVEGFKDVAINDIPKTTKEANVKYDSAFLQKMGILPWYIQDVMIKLTAAMKQKRKTEILFLAADLGHYLGDANMPFHTSLNHDGQLTGQKGIHALWESELPDYFGNSYDFKVKPAEFLPDVTTATWDIIKHTHSLLDTALLADKNLRQKFGTNMFKKDANGVIIKNKFGAQIFSYEYAKAFHESLNGMVEKQMKHAIQDVSNFWYTAWVNAGKPDLNGLDPKEITDRNKKFMKRDTKLIEKGKVFGFKVETEFER